MSVRQFWVFAVLLIVFWYSPIAAAVTCQPLQTEYQIRSSNWYWLDNETVIFETWNGARPHGLFTTPSIIVWYEYNFATRTLRDIPNNPLDVLPDNARTLIGIEEPNTDDLGGENTNLELYWLANGDRFIYPREAGDDSEYWYVDTATGTEINLGITFQDNVNLRAFWSADRSRVILHDPFLSNAVFPARLIELQENNAVITILEDVNEFRQLGLNAWPFVVMGFSPDGQNVVVDPYILPTIHVFDFTNGRWTDVGLRPRYDRIIRWVSENVFVVLTNVGVVAYDVDSHVFDVIATLEQLGRNFGSASLSPNAEYLIGEYSDVGERGFLVCNLEEG